MLPAEVEGAACIQHPRRLTYSCLTLAWQPRRDLAAHQLGCCRAWVLGGDAVRNACTCAALCSGKCKCTVAGAHRQLLPAPKGTHYFHSHSDSHLLPFVQTRLIVPASLTQRLAGPSGAPSPSINPAARPALHAACDACMHHWHASRVASVRRGYGAAMALFTGVNVTVNVNDLEDISEEDRMIRLRRTGAASHACVCMYDYLHTRLHSNTHTAVSTRTLTPPTTGSVWGRAVWHGSMCGAKRHGRREVVVVQGGPRLVSGRSGSPNPRGSMGGFPLGLMRGSWAAAGSA